MDVKTFCLAKHPSLNLTRVQDNKLVMETLDYHDRHHSTFFSGQPPRDAAPWNVQFSFAASNPAMDLSEGPRQWGEVGWAQGQARTQPTLSAYLRIAALC